MEVAEIRVRNTVLIEVVDLAVVEQAGNDVRYTSRADASGDILAVATAASGCIVLVYTSLTDRLCDCGQIVIPSDVRRAMIGAVHIVMDHNDLFVGGW